MSELTEAEVIRDIAREALRPAVLTAGCEYVFRKAGGNIEIIDRSDTLPARKVGTVCVSDVASFAAYWAKHRTADSEVFADLDQATVTAVLDAHGEDYAAWQEHRLVLKLRLTEPWRTWLEHDRKFMSQVAFAEHLEDNYGDLDPGGPVKAADLLEAAQKFEATVKVEYGAGERLQSGDVTMRRIETTEQATGKKGYITFPEEMDLSLKPYEDCDDTVISARLRYRITPEGLKLGYFLNEPERTRVDAVRQVTAKAAEAIDFGIMQGSPA